MKKAPIKGAMMLILKAMPMILIHVWLKYFQNVIDIAFICVNT